MAAPCGELLGGDSDAKRHLKGCASCLESGLAHYPVPFEELRYTIIEGARRDPIHGWQFNTDN
ncbi:hypothetical protein BDQ17DRAFT_1358364 [Cyathus striatus]|nr:hypothetical protein BDQ17DRAFT_1358364 [Cyathus striatus]